MQEQSVIQLSTRGQGLYEFTAEVARFVGDSKIGAGLLTLFCRHTSCSLLIQENADPDVKTDLQEFFSRIAPEGLEWVSHVSEGPDDMPAHIRAALTQVCVSIPVTSGQLALGTWQGIYLFEHRAQAHNRQIVAYLSGD
ncbi:MAG TPA: YjbQ family protein [Devosia sp.]|nr:YjbQ family protein [Devosia sp.]